MLDFDPATACRRSLVVGEAFRRDDSILASCSPIALTKPTRESSVALISLISSSFV